jgi:hypothetical protein
MMRSSRTGKGAVILAVLGVAILFGCSACGPSSAEKQLKKEMEQQQKTQSEKRAKICPLVIKLVSRCNSAIRMTSVGEAERMISEAYSDVEVALGSDFGFSDREVIVSQSRRLRYFAMEQLNARQMGTKVSFLEEIEAAASKLGNICR